MVILNEIKTILSLSSNEGLDSDLDVKEFQRKQKVMGHVWKSNQCVTWIVRK